MTEGRPLIDVLFPDEAPMTQTTPDLARRLRRLLDERGLSISEAARMAGVEKQRAWLVVTGRNANPTWNTLERLVTGVGGTFQELFADD